MKKQAQSAFRGDEKDLNSGEQTPPAFDRIELLSLRVPSLQVHDKSLLLRMPDTPVTPEGLGDGHQRNVRGRESCKVLHPLRSRPQERSSHFHLWVDAKDIAVVSQHRSAHIEIHSVGCNPNLHRAHDGLLGLLIPPVQLVGWQWHDGASGSEGVRRVKMKTS